MKSSIGIALIGLALLGAGCTETSNAIAYETFTAGNTGMTFDVPTGVTVHDNVNGFEDIWKFEHDGDSYIISYNLVDGQAIYAPWEDIQGDRDIEVTTNGDVKIYKDAGMANTEAFHLQREPAATIAVYKHEGTSLNGETSTDDDAVYQHLVESVTLDGAAAF